MISPVRTSLWSLSPYTLSPNDRLQSNSKLHPNPPHVAQAQDRDGWTCLHHALSLPNPSPAAAAWISAALALPGAGALHNMALRDIASGPTSMTVNATSLQLFQGDTNAAQVMVISCQA